jgi:benzoyl-CoA-dihydrodiol lyase
MELADAIQRLRFEHPNVKVVVVGSAQERAFCAGANIMMLAESTHPFKVNFCKFTNETRLSLEDASQHSGLKSICAINAACAGGGYELALACDEIHLVNDNNSAVSLPEVPLLGVLPGTGGLTRLVDKRKIRRDLADAFSTIAEGVRGKRALEWGLVDEAPPKAKLEEVTQRRVDALVARSKRKAHPKMALPPLEAKRTDARIEYTYVTLDLDTKKRTARLVVKAPTGNEPKGPAEMTAASSAARKNRLDLSVGIALGSASQIALFVAPMLVLVSYFVGPAPMDLEFWPAAIMMMLVATITAVLVTNSGRSAWFIGVLVMNIYLVFAVTLYLLPSPQERETFA